MSLAEDLGYSTSELELQGPKAAIAKESIQQDYAKADIYYQTLNVRTITQSPKYSVILFATKFECNS